MKDNILEGELRMRRSTDKPEKEDENYKKDNAGKEDKKYSVDLWGLRWLIKTRIFFFDRVAGCPSFT